MSHKNGSSYSSIVIKNKKELVYIWLFLLVFRRFSLGNLKVVKQLWQLYDLAKLPKLPKVHLDIFWCFERARAGQWPGLALFSATDTVLESRKDATINCKTIFALNKALELCTKNIQGQSFVPIYITLWLHRRSNVIINHQSRRLLFSCADWFNVVETYSYLNSYNNADYIIKSNQIFHIQKKTEEVL